MRTTVVRFSNAWNGGPRTAALGKSQKSALAKLAILRKGITMTVVAGPLVLWTPLRVAS
jgi:hypothetical protein